jgi:hypothetical protein
MLNCQGSWHPAPWDRFGARHGRLGALPIDQLRGPAPDEAGIPTRCLELALGDTSKSADERRCREISDELERRNLAPTASMGRTTDSAYRAFEFYHGQPYCSTGVGKPAKP